MSTLAPSEPAARAGSLPLTDGQRPRAEQLPVRIFVIVPLLAQEFRWIRDVRRPTPARLARISPTASEPAGR